jgi:Rad3-related DNA helicase
MPTGKLLYHNSKEPFVMCQTAREVLLYIPSLYNTPNHEHTAHTHHYIYSTYTAQMDGGLILTAAGDSSSPKELRKLPGVII